MFLLLPTPPSTALTTLLPQCKSFTHPPSTILPTTSTDPLITPSTRCANIAPQSDDQTVQYLSVAPLPSQVHSRAASGINSILSGELLRSCRSSVHPSACLGPEIVQYVCALLSQPLPLLFFLKLRIFYPHKDSLPLDIRRSGSSSRIQALQILNKTVACCLPYPGDHLHPGSQLRADGMVHDHSLVW